MPRIEAPGSQSPLLPAQSGAQNQKKQESEAQRIAQNALIPPASVPSQKELLSLDNSDFVTRIATLAFEVYLYSEEKKKSHGTSIIKAGRKKFISFLVPRIKKILIEICNKDEQNVKKASFIDLLLGLKRNIDTHLNKELMTQLANTPSREEKLRILEAIIGEMRDLLMPKNMIGDCFPGFIENMIRKSCEGYIATAVIEYCEMKLLYDNALKLDENLAEGKVLKPVSKMVCSTLAKFLMDGETVNTLAEKASGTLAETLPAKKAKDVPDGKKAKPVEKESKVPPVPASLKPLLSVEIKEFGKAIASEPQVSVLIEGVLSRVLKKMSQTPPAESTGDPIADAAINLAEMVSRFEKQYPGPDKPFDHLALELSELVGLSSSDSLVSKSVLGFIQPYMTSEIPDILSKKYQTYIFPLLEIYKSLTIIPKLSADPKLASVQQPIDQLADFAVKKAQNLCIQDGQALDGKTLLGPIVADAVEDKLNTLINEFFPGAAKKQDAPAAGEEPIAPAPPPPSEFVREAGTYISAALGKFGSSKDARASIFWKAIEQNVKHIVSNVLLQNVEGEAQDLRAVAIDNICEKLAAFFSNEQNLQSINGRYEQLRREYERREKAGNPLQTPEAEHYFQKKFDALSKELLEQIIGVREVGGQRVLDLNVLGLPPLVTELISTRLIGKTSLLLAWGYSTIKAPLYSADDYQRQLSELLPDSREGERVVKNEKREFIIKFVNAFGDHYLTSQLDGLLASPLEKYTGSGTIPSVNGANHRSERHQLVGGLSKSVIFQVLVHAIQQAQTDGVDIQKRIEELIGKYRPLLKQEIEKNGSDPERRKSALKKVSQEFSKEMLNILFGKGYLEKDLPLDLPSSSLFPVLGADFWKSFKTENLPDIFTDLFEQLMVANYRDADSTVRSLSNSIATKIRAGINVQDFSDSMQLANLKASLSTYFHSPEISAVIDHAMTEQIMKEALVLVQKEKTGEMPSQTGDLLENYLDSVLANSIKKLNIFTSELNKDNKNLLLEAVTEGMQEVRDQLHRLNNQSSFRLFGAPTRESRHAALESAPEGSLLHPIFLNEEGVLKTRTQAEKEIKQLKKAVVKKKEEFANLKKAEHERLSAELQTAEAELKEIQRNKERVKKELKLVEEFEETWLQKDQQRKELSEQREETRRKLIAQGLLSQKEVLRGEKDLQKTNEKKLEELKTECRRNLLSPAKKEKESSSGEAVLERSELLSFNDVNVNDKELSIDQIIQQTKSKAPEKMTEYESSEESQKKECGKLEKARDAIKEKIKNNVLEPAQIRELQALDTKIVEETSKIESCNLQLMDLEERRAKGVTDPTVEEMRFLRKRKRDFIEEFEYLTGFGKISKLKKQIDKIEKTKLEGINQKKKLEAEIAELEKKGASADSEEISKRKRQIDKIEKTRLEGMDQKKKLEAGIEQLQSKADSAKKRVIAKKSKQCAAYKEQKRMILNLKNLNQDYSFSIVADKMMTPGDPDSFKFEISRKKIAKVEIEKLVKENEGLESELRLKQTERQQKLESIPEGSVDYAKKLHEISEFSHAILKLQKSILHNKQHIHKYEKFIKSCSATEIEFLDKKIKETEDPVGFLRDQIEDVNRDLHEMNMRQIEYRKNFFIPLIEKSLSLAGYSKPEDLHACGVPKELCQSYWTMLTDKLIPEFLTYAVGEAYVSFLNPDSVNAMLFDVMEQFTTSLGAPVTDSGTKKDKDKTKEQLELEALAESLYKEVTYLVPQSFIKLAREQSWITRNVGKAAEELIRTQLNSKMIMDALKTYAKSGTVKNFFESKETHFAEGYVKDYEEIDKANKLRAKSVQTVYAVIEQPLENRLRAFWEKNGRNWNNLGKALCNRLPDSVAKVLKNIYHVLGEVIIASFLHTCYRLFRLPIKYVMRAIKKLIEVTYLKLRVNAFIQNIHPDIHENTVLRVIDRVANLIKTEDTPAVPSAAAPAVHAEKAEPPPLQTPELALNTILERIALHAKEGHIMIVDGLLGTLQEGPFESLMEGVDVKAKLSDSLLQLGEKIHQNGILSELGLQMAEQIFFSPGHLPDYLPGLNESLIAAYTVVKSIADENSTLKQAQQAKESVTNVKKDIGPEDRSFEARLHHIRCDLLLMMAKHREEQIQAQGPSRGSQANVPPNEPAVPQSAADKKASSTARRWFNFGK